MKRYFISILMLIALVVLLLPTNSASAVESLVIDGEDFIAVRNMPDSIVLTATLSDDSSFFGRDIVWYRNNILETTTASAHEKSSVLTVSLENVTITRATEWTFKAEIRTNNNIKDEFVIQFGFTEISSAELKLFYADNQEIINTSNQFSLTQTISETSRNIIFKCQPDGYPETLSYQWFVKSQTNKYEPVNSTTNEYLFEIKKTNNNVTTYVTPGEYTFCCRVNGIMSEPITYTVNYKQISSITITHEKNTRGETGFGRYTFTITFLGNTNIHQSNQVFYDINNIKWYNQGTLIQTGGTTYQVQVNELTYLNIYAEYGSIVSNKEEIDVKINRNSDILLAVGIFIAFMTLITTISIIINIKKDKIW